MYEVVERKRVEASRLRQEGFDLMARGDLTTAIERHEAAAELNQELDDKGALAGDLTNTAIILERIEGREAEARALHERALELDLEVDFKPGLRIDYGNLARLSAERGELGAALDQQSQLITVCESLGDFDRVAAELRDRGLMLAHLHRHRDAVESHLRAHALNSERGRLEAAAGDLTNVAICYENLGMEDSALEYHDRACAIDEAADCLDGLIIDYQNLVRLNYARGDRPAAETYRAKLESVLSRMRASTEDGRSFSASCIGSRAEISIYRTAPDRCSVSYRLPSPIRRRHQELETRVDGIRLDSLNEKIQAVTSMAGESKSLRRASRDDSARLRERQVAERLEDLGKAMYALVLPPAVKQAYRQTGSADAIELGLSDNIVHYPWELMHDGDSYLCLRRSIGRFVMSDMPESPALATGRKDDLRVLVVGDPCRADQPHYIHHPKLSPLAGARRESEEVTRLLDGVNGVKVRTLVGEDASVTRVVAELSTGYDIIHFSGHAQFSANNPEESVLVFHDGDLTSYEILQCITTSQNRPLLALINACESSREGDWIAELTYENEVFGLASAFLRAGVNYIGSVWPVHDEAAVDIAITVYRGFFSGLPVGEALRRARHHVLESHGPGELAWASYVLYGDPTLALTY